MIVEIHAEHPEPRKVHRAVEALRAGEVIAYPTDTVYALGCDLMERRAIDRMYQMKGMPRTQQLALICPDLSDIARYARVSNQQYRLLRRLLPGPFTFILEASREVPRMLQSRRKTVGIRVPASASIVAVVRELGRPVLSTSAAPHGEEPYLDARTIDVRYPALGLVLDGGPGGTVPTTILDLTEGVLVRQGAGSVDGLF
jgi:tRNA threonylcarbamoyl adenosine modification protein (Sua5/YciO/YrdC/YwlC family)